MFYNRRISADALAIGVWMSENEKQSGMDDRRIIYLDKFPAISMNFMVP